jgi:hypothetical protein
MNHLQAKVERIHSKHGQKLGKRDKKNKKKAVKSH